MILLMTRTNSRGLWLHGFLGDGREGNRLCSKGSLDALREDIFCPTLPGHGLPPEACLSLSDTLDRIAEWAHGREWAAGYSMGGRLLMMAAARHPDAFSTLILESASLGYSDPEARKARREVDRDRADRLRAMGLPDFTEWWYALPIWKGSSPPPIRQGDPESLARALTTFSSGHQPDMRNWLRSTSCRILWLAGERDRGYVEQATEVSRIAPRVSVRIIPEAGHNIHHDQPDLWRDAVQSFLTQSFSKEQ
jgi:2-succinyl-6-hydroxy-2,4-cyclohexadiene-1-carboxylate synthase